jgi:hypothetical protein
MAPLGDGWSEHGGAVRRDRTRRIHQRDRIYFRIRVSIIVVALVAWGLAPAFANAGDIAPKQVPQITVKDGSVLVSKGQQQVLEYVFREGQYKPYVLQLFTPAGLNILRDGAPDEPHQHGLMFGVEVEGKNFWQEGPLGGRQVHKNIKPDATGFVESVDWIDQVEKQVLLTEERQIGVDVSMELTTLVFWRSKFKLASNRTTVKISGTDYKGLGMRFIPSMDHSGTFICGRTKLGKANISDKQLIQAPWCAYSAEVNSKPVTVAMFSHPSNVRPATWFLMLNPYALFSGTLSLHSAPIVLNRDQPMVLRYGIAVWDGAPSSDRIEEVYTSWFVKVVDN